MKTQISKISFDAEKRYSGVYQQQGRMLTDADWNNLVDILKGQLAEALKDVVGNGSPRNGALSITQNRNIQPGDVYIDGLRAVLPGKGAIAASKQPDLPKSPDLPDTGPYVVYADVWERSLTALEDSGLRDPGLNGADTCTRTQAMLQIKSCADDVNPEKDIPQKGNAELSLDLHDNLETSDPCDPCAGVVGAGAGRVGNYLFRLEVHAVSGDAAQPTELTLKWSSENGAEQYEAKSEGEMPPGFVNSRFLYEFYNPTTEKHPGVHITEGFTPCAGILKTPYEIPDGPSDPKEFVRRWDGYCELKNTKSGWILVKGWDKGVDLSTEIAADQPGHVAVGSELTVNLEAFRMTLELKDKKLKDKTFVVGDYWLAPIREAVHSADSPVCSGALPDGIEHHYLRLAAVTAKGKVEPYEDDADRRRRTFPPLTDLHAQDVGFPKPCNTGIYQDRPVSTVEDALKLLCDIQASQVSYQAGADCVYLNKPDIKTVQDAIDALCRQPTSGGCKVSVGNDGQFPTIEEAIQTFTGAGVFDICLCLLRGNHPLGKIEREEDFLNLSITGCGPGTVLRPTESAEFIGINSLHLEHLRIDSLEEEHPVVISNCGEVTLNQVQLLGMAPEEALLWVSDTVQVSMNHCVMEAYQEQVLKVPREVFDFAQELASLFDRPGRGAFLESAAIQAEKLAEMSIDDRKKMAEQLEAVLEEFTDDDDEISLNELFSYQRLLPVLKLEKPGKLQFLDALRDIRDQAHHAVAGHALIFNDALARVSILNSRIYGQITLYGPPGGDYVFTKGEIGQLAEILNTPQLTLVPWTTDFIVQGTLLTRLALSGKRVDEIRQIIDIKEGQTATLTGFYKAAQIADSVFAANDNLLLFGETTLNGNNFEYQEPNSSDTESPQPIVGSVIGQTAIYTGNRIYLRVFLDAPPRSHGGIMLPAVRDLQKAANMPEVNWYEVNWYKEDRDAIT